MNGHVPPHTVAHGGAPATASSYSAQTVHVKHSLFTSQYSFESHWLCSTHSAPEQKERTMGGIMDVERMSGGSNTAGKGRGLRRHKPAADLYGDMRQQTGTGNTRRGWGTWQVKLHSFCILYDNGDGERSHNCTERGDRS